MKFMWHWVQHKINIFKYIIHCWWGKPLIAGPLSNLINRCLEMVIFPSAEKFPKINLLTNQVKERSWRSIEQSPYSPLFRKSWSQYYALRDNLDLITDDLLNTRLQSSQIASEPIWTRALWLGVVIFLSTKGFWHGGPCKTPV